MLLLKKKAFLLSSLSFCLFFFSCAHNAKQKRDIASSEEKKSTINREPFSMEGNFKWLNKVQNEFNRIASETSNRNIANKKKDRVLIQDKNWSFYFSPENNFFYLKVKAKTYTMVQPSVTDKNYFSFVPEESYLESINLTISKEDKEFKNRKAASAIDKCQIELSFWDQKNKYHERSKKRLKGFRCKTLIKTIENYVP